jgi:hypothetical protein
LREVEHITQKKGDTIMALSNEMSAADIAAVTGYNNGYGNGFGGDGW